MALPVVADTEVVERVNAGASGGAGGTTAALTVKVYVAVAISVYTYPNSDKVTNSPVIVNVWVANGTVGTPEIRAVLVSKLNPAGSDGEIENELSASPLKTSVLSLSLTL